MNKRETIIFRIYIWISVMIITQATEKYSKSNVLAASGVAIIMIRTISASISHNYKMYKRLERASTLGVITCFRKKQYRLFPRSSYLLRLVYWYNGGNNMFSEETI